MRLGDFELYKDLIKDKSGISLTPDKSYLLDSRLTPVAKKWNFETIDAMTMSLRALPDPKLVKEIVQAMTTNETSFFRDDRPFQTLKNLLFPYLFKARKKTKSIRLWSAACSAGQEPYTIAMVFDELLAANPGWKLDVIATDLADHVLDYARAGVYSQFEVQRGLSIHMLMKYFKQDGTSWKLNENIRKMVKYENFNLLEPMEKFGTLDIIFCRNVLIYFDEETKKKILANLARRLAPDGFLFLGGAETILGLCQDLRIMPGYNGLYVHQAAQYDPVDFPPPVKK